MFEGRFQVHGQYSDPSPSDRPSIAIGLGGTKKVDDSKLPAAAEYDYVRFFARQ